MDAFFKFKIDLQIFASDEKTEEATPKKKEEARKKGQIAKSNDLPQVGTLLAGVVVIRYMFKFYFEYLYRILSNHFKDIAIDELTFEVLREVLLKFSVVFVVISGPVLFTVLLVGLLANYIQVGVMFTLDPVKPKFSKVNPLSGLKKLFSLKKLVDLIKNIVKMTLIGFYSYATVKKELLNIVQIPQKGLFEGYILIFNLAYSIVMKIALVLFIIAIIDYAYQKWEHNKSLRMSKQEIKDEFKQSEGDPMIKGRMRQMQRALLKKKMIQEVPNATVVITNPTHLSLALKYEKGMVAPLLLAKGADSVAMRIREIAKENNIPMYENKPLARALYQSVEIGEEIPEEFYQTVAEILMMVMKNEI